LPASTQWELIEAASETPQVIYEALIGVAAQGRLLFNDDTHMRVQSVRKEITAAGSEQERTGIFTTSIISKVDQRRIALFFTGQKHAGENLNQLLQRRATGLDQPMQMCDALSRNEPKEFHTLLCHCLLHGRRQFVDVVESFPEECRKVIETLRDVYRFDALTKEQKLSDLDRLAFHQAHSQPVMDDLQKWMREQIEQKKVEPNSGLGEAIQYMLKRWQTLTRFLSVPGAPLDNNVAYAASGISDIMPTTVLCRVNGRIVCFSAVILGFYQMARGIFGRPQKEPFAELVRVASIGGVSAQPRPQAPTGRMTRKAWETPWPQTFQTDYRKPLGLCRVRVHGNAWI
jgi:hypothetical protein